MGNTAKITTVIAVCASIMSKSVQKDSRFYGLSTKGKIIALSSIANAVIESYDLEKDLRELKVFREWIDQFYQKIVIPWTEE